MNNFASSVVARERAVRNVLQLHGGVTLLADPTRLAMKHISSRQEWEGDFAVLYRDGTVTLDEETLQQREKVLLDLYLAAEIEAPIRRHPELSNPVSREFGKVPSNVVYERDPEVDTLFAAAVANKAHPLWANFHLLEQADIWFDTKGFTRGKPQGPIALYGYQEKVAAATNAQDRILIDQRAFAMADKRRPALRALFRMVGRETASVRERDTVVMDLLANPYDRRWDRFDAEWKKSLGEETLSYRPSRDSLRSLMAPADPYLTPQEIGSRRSCLERVFSFALRAAQNSSDLAENDIMHYRDEILCDMLSDDGMRWVGPGKQLGAEWLRSLDAFSPGIVLPQKAISFHIEEEAQQSGQSVRQLYDELTRRGHSEFSLASIEVLRDDENQRRKFADITLRNKPMVVYECQIWNREAPLEDPITIEVVAINESGAQEWIARREAKYPHSVTVAELRLANSDDLIEFADRYGSKDLFGVRFSIEKYAREHRPLTGATR
jgi:hypothetical protein